MPGLPLLATVVLSGLIALLGLVLIVETVIVDGTLGFLLGGLLVLAGGLRLVLVLRKR